MVFEIVRKKTELGADYTEYYYFDRNMMPCEKEIATRAILRECKEDGTLVNEQILVLKKENV